MSKTLTGECLHHDPEIINHHWNWYPAIDVLLWFIYALEYGCLP